MWSLCHKQIQAQLHNAEILHSDWSKEVTGLGASNQSTLFQQSVFNTLKCVYNIRCYTHQVQEINHICLVKSQTSIAKTRHTATQPSSGGMENKCSMVVEVCIKQGMCTAPHPLQVLCLVCCKNRPVDGATYLLVQF